MAKTAKDKKYTPAIVKRILSIMEEVVREGRAGSYAEFLVSIGDVRTAKYDYETGRRAPTPEQIATACRRYGYSPTWILLGIGDKKLLDKKTKTVEVRVKELEAIVDDLKTIIQRSK